MKKKMPLLRYEVRNEYGLGLPELYREANKEDPKAVLDGVAVAGLVGILRQLGDLAQFAAEVFHGLQEQVMTTASRSHKLTVRLQDIEAALPPLEKAVLAQTSHLHFCYTAGSDWHPRIRNKRNHFIYNDLPRFIMDSYEECRDPPRLHLLDKFDTGGPGSCLKRYSDPSFFKRVSATSNELNAERQRDKKARKSKKKKKRSLQRNGEVSRSASVLSGSGRILFDASHDYDQASPAQSVSNIDMTFKSDLGDRSHSFDSRTGSGFIECVFHPSSSMQPDKQEPKESSSSCLKLQNDENLDSAFHDHTRIEDDDDDFLCSSLQEQSAPHSSCVTWDEKTEIVEPEGQHCDSDEGSDMLQIDSCLDMEEQLAVNIRHVDPVDILLDVENIPESISGGNQLDDIESEPDNYMDALNTIESESENDFDCQTKREVAQYSSNFNNSEVEGGMHDVMVQNSDHHLSIESQTASGGSSNEGMSCDLPHLVSLESFTHEDLPIAGVASNEDSVPGNDFSGSNNILDSSKLESSGSEDTDSQNPTGDKVINSVGESQESAEFSGIHPVQFWTNGGLLGLEPSKPPDFSVASAVSQNSVSGSKINTISPSGHAATIKDGVRNGRLYNQEDATDINKTSLGKFPANLDTKSGDSHHSNRLDDIHGRELDGTSVLTPKSERSISSDAKATFTETSQENNQVFGLGHRLLVNGFRRKASLGNDDKFETANSPISGAFEHKSGFRTVANNSFSETTFKEHPGNGSSPPLEHMKISFQPMNDFETSKLRLKFPDGSHCQEFNRDMLPSFQLVPEPASLLHEIGIDSDDDTFCRSCSSISDDCLSHHSDSNSEQWESSGTPNSKDHELYDALCRISSMESVSSSLELKGTLHGSSHLDSALKSSDDIMGVAPSFCGPLLDLPSFDAVKSSLHQAVVLNSEPKESLGLECPKEPTPPPPPLPPVQWRVLKSNSDMTEDKQDFESEDLGHAFDMKHLQSVIPLEQTPPASAKQEQIITETILSMPKSTQQDQQKLNGQKEIDQAANGQGMDEKEDFLQQIRTKSFNLRRTLTAKPTSTPAPSTNVKVTAILEKANAIRQAVGSDDGEDDDTWSDA